MIIMIDLALNTDTINFIKGNVTIFGLILKV